MSKAMQQISQMANKYITDLQQRIDNYVEDPQNFNYNDKEGFVVTIHVFQVVQKVQKHFKDQGYDTEYVDTDRLLRVRFPLE
jgi:hypothetical protein